MNSNGDALRSARATALIGQVRLAIGFFQGVGAWLLLRLVAPSYNVASGVERVHAPFWASRHPMIFASLALVTAYVPVVAIAEIARMRRKTLAIYLSLVSTGVAALAAYDIWRDPIERWGVDPGPRVWPSFTASFCTTLGLFIVNQLLEHRERGNTLFTHYADHFEDSWMRAFQLVLSAIFSLLVWAMLELGAGLFHLINVEWVRNMIEHNWFRCPALAVAFAAAVHVTDVRPALLEGVRNVGLTLFSWLLPIVVTLEAGFLIALGFVGVKPLWATGHAASILLWASAITVMQVNAAYKDGDPFSLPPVALRWTARIAGPIVLSLVLLATYAIGLRVNQYGWTPERVFSAAAAFMIVVYGAGYTYASVRRESWLTPLENVNVAASLIIVGILALLLSPAADPARVSVNSQLRRLALSKISPGQFDYEFLRFESGLFGTRALARLTDDPNEDVRVRAVRMQRIKTRTFHAPGEPDPAVTEPAFSHATVYPRNARLPDDFRNTDFSKKAEFASSCLRDGTPCDIYILPYGAPGDSALMVRSHNSESGSQGAYFSLSGQVFQRDGEGQWVNTGAFSAMGCPSLVAALREGTATPVRSEYDDLLVDGVRIRFSPAPRSSGVCAKNVSPPPANSQDKPRDAAAPVQMGPAFGKP